MIETSSPSSNAAFSSSFEIFSGASGSAIAFMMRNARILRLERSDTTGEFSAAKAGESAAPRVSGRFGSDAGDRGSASMNGSII